MESSMTNKKDETFYVIGAGLPRTGTLSLMHALEILLPGKCYHGGKALHHETQWCDVIRGKYSDEEFKNFILSSKYVAGVDLPFCYYYERNMRVFPNAKVVLTVRDPESWTKSINFIGKIHSSFWYYPVYLFSIVFPDYLLTIHDDLRLWSVKLLYCIDRNAGAGPMLSECLKGKGVEVYTKWVHEVQLNVPAEKLLTFHVKDGWEPLCRHLNLPIPDVPFPNVNSTEVMSSALNLNMRKAWILLYECVAIPLLVYGVYKN